MRLIRPFAFSIVHTAIWARLRSPPPFTPCRALTCARTAHQGGTPPNPPGNLSMVNVSTSESTHAWWRLRRERPLASAVKKQGPHRSQGAAKILMRGCEWAYSRETATPPSRWCHMFVCWVLRFCDVAIRGSERSSGLLMLVTMRERGGSYQATIIIFQ